MLKLCVSYTTGPSGHAEVKGCVRKSVGLNQWRLVSVVTSKYGHVLHHGIRAENVPDTALHRLKQ